MDLISLLKSKKIQEWEYKSYLLFQANDQGREYLKKVFEGVYMEDPPAMDNECPFAWQDGRRSVWRDIKHCIARVDLLLSQHKEVINE